MAVVSTKKSRETNEGLPLTVQNFIHGALHAELVPTLEDSC